MAMLGEMYQREGAEAVRHALRQGGNPDEAIEWVIGQLEQQRIMGILRVMYQREGADAVRQALQGNPEGVIAAVMRDLGAE